MSIASFVEAISDQSSVYLWGSPQFLYAWCDGEEGVSIHVEHSNKGAQIAILSPFEQKLGVSMLAFRCIVLLLPSSAIIISVGWHKRASPTAPAPASRHAN